MPPRTREGSVGLGQAIQERRVALGLSIEEAAAKAGVTAKSWGRYESGNAIRQDKIRGLMKALGWSSFPEVDGALGDTDIGFFQVIDRSHEAWSEALCEEYGRMCATVFAAGSDLLVDELTEDLAELSQHPRGTHLGELDASWLAGSLPAQFALRYDYEFLFGLRAAVMVLRLRGVHGIPVAHTVLEELALYLVLRKAELFADIDPDAFGDDDDWREWLGGLLGDLDIELYLYNRYLVLGPGFPYHFDRWTEGQFWLDDNNPDDADPAVPSNSDD